MRVGRERPSNDEKYSNARRALSGQCAERQESRKGRVHSNICGTLLMFLKSWLFLKQWALKATMLTAANLPRTVATRTPRTCRSCLGAKLFAAMLTVAKSCSCLHIVLHTHPKNTKRTTLPVSTKR
eukprot:6488769-Amphidinium_carterae.1